MKCLGCEVVFTPRVREALCPECVHAVVGDPDAWLALLAKFGL